jgi:hypothetical protein
VCGGIGHAPPAAGRAEAAALAHAKGTRRSQPQASQWSRRQPWASTPQAR